MGRKCGVSPFFVQATPGEILKKRIQEVANSSGFQLRIVEKGGRTLKSMLMKSDVKPNKRCWDQECPICMTGEQGKCNKENAGYTIQCKTCWESEEKKDASFKQKRYIMHHLKKPWEVRVMKIFSCLTQMNSLLPLFPPPEKDMLSEDEFTKCSGF